MNNERHYFNDPMLAYPYPNGFYKLRKDTENGKKMWWAEKAKDGRYYAPQRPVPDMPYCRVADARSDLFFVVEGEKCVDAVYQWLKFNALTGNKGGDYWCEAFSAPLAGKNVIIIPDNDEIGKGYAEKALASLKAQAASVRVFCPWEWWEDIGAKEDIYDAISKHGAAEVHEKLLGFIEGEIPPQRENSETADESENAPAPPSSAVTSCIYVQFFKERLRELKILNDTQFVAAVRAFLLYAETGNLIVPEDDTAKIVFLNMADDFDRAARRYVDKTAKNKKAADMRWGNI